MRGGACRPCLGCPGRTSASRPQPPAWGGGLGERGHPRAPATPAPVPWLTPREAGGGRADAFTDTSARLPWADPAARPAPASPAAPGVQGSARAVRTGPSLCRLTWHISNIIALYPQRRVCRRVLRGRAGSRGAARGGAGGCRAAARSTARCPQPSCPQFVMPRMSPAIAKWPLRGEIALFDSHLSKVCLCVNFR